VSRKDPEAQRQDNRIYYLAHAEELRAKKRLYQAERRKQEPEKIRLIQQKNYYAHQEERLTYRRNYYETHQEYIILWRQNYNETHKEQRAEHNKAYRQTHKERLKAKNRAYRHQHKERLSAKRHVYYMNNRERIIAKIRAWVVTHPDNLATYAAKRRAWHMQAEHNDLTQPQWEEIKAAYGYRCVYCGRKMQRLTRDHITPLSKGGSHTASNIVPACGSCNSIKHTNAPLKPIQPLLLTLAKPQAKKTG